MLNQSDMVILEKRGIIKSQIQEQLHSFVVGFPYLPIEYAAELNKGIVRLTDNEMEVLKKEWEVYLQGTSTILKFVPASGAASRMFKDLFEFLEGEESVPSKPFEQFFFGNIQSFAFYDDLNSACQQHEGKDILLLMAEGKYKKIVEYLLLDVGLSYGGLPKGLLKFHSYPDLKRTPFQEHLVEGALYATAKSKIVNIHFTVSNEHRILFENHLKESISYFESLYGVSYQVEFSEQKPSTDTIAVDMHNEPFRDEHHALVFRPGGHGALIENLNDLKADIIFIKNIDNVVPDRLKSTTVEYKKLIAGMLVHIQQRCFKYLQLLDEDLLSKEMLQEIKCFCEQELNILRVDTNTLSEDEQKGYFRTKLNRPIRICGMVRNVGEPGGGPFIAMNQDGTFSPQILESSQINQDNQADRAKMMQSTHFNPVDLVCGVRNYKGEKFNLLDYVDKNTGFISLKSKNGKELKALELPGLWNGAMSDWNTVFVEVPIETFNPVKTVNDLLRLEHQ